jgi:hypothetical protein
LRVFDVERLPTHGGSIRVLSSAVDRGASAMLQEVRAEEAARGVATDGFYEGFEARVRATLGGFRAFLSQARAEGRRIGAYGAAAKGNTFLNAAGLNAAGLNAAGLNAAGVTAVDILAVADRSPAKQGRLLPGSRIPVVTPEALLGMPLDDILVLPWNIGAEVAAQLRGDGFRGRILTAVPEMRELSPVRGA